MSASSTSEMRRIISGLIVLAMLLLSGAPSSEMLTGHSYDQGRKQAVASAMAAQHCADMAPTKPDQGSDTCCLGYACATPAVAAFVPPAVRVAWSAIHYWTDEPDGSGIRLEPALGPPKAHA
jgi:hypothetical protein